MTLVTDPCVDCCTCAALGQTVKVMFSGITFCCVIFGGTTTTFKSSAAINDTFTLMEGTGPYLGTWSLTIPNGITTTLFTGPDCSGTSSTSMSDLLIQLSCSSPFAPSIVYTIEVYSPLGDFFYAQSSVRSPIPNNYTAGCFFGVNAAFGGTASIIL